MARIQQRNAKENGNETPTERKRNGVAHNGNGNFFLSATVGPAIITRGFIFFIFIAYRKLKLNYAMVFLTFDPLISFFISPTVQLRLTPNISQALTCLCSIPRTNFVIKTTNATSKD